jgi:hypothetical protein
MSSHNLEETKMLFHPRSIISRLVQVIDMVRELTVNRVALIAQAIPQSQIASPHRTALRSVAFLHDDEVFRRDRANMVRYQSTTLHSPTTFGKNRMEVNSFESFTTARQLILSGEYTFSEGWRQLLSDLYVLN